MSEFKQIQNLTNTGPKIGHIIAGAVGGLISSGKKGGFSSSETRNKMRDREHSAYVSNALENEKHRREMQKSQQFQDYESTKSKDAHTRALEAQGVALAAVESTANRYPHATEIKHGGTSIKFGKRSGSSPKPTTKPEDTSKNAKPKSNKPKPPSNKGNKGSKSGKGKTK